MDNSSTVHDDETAAVLEVIAAESEAFFNKDFESFSRCWVHAPYVRRLGWWTRGGVSDHRGWEALSDLTSTLMRDNPEPNRSARELRRENLVVRVMGDMAWASFDQYAPDTGEPDVDMPGLSREVRVLEKHDGQWRIAYHTYVHQTNEPVRSALYRVDKDSNVSWMNTAGAELIKRGGNLAMSRGRLRAGNDTDTRKLRAAIVDASARDNTLDGGRAAIPIILEQDATDEVCVCWVLTEGSSSGAVLVSINNLTFAQDHIDAAAGVFKFSASQQRLAEHILAGQDLVTSAARMGITVNTARTHLQRIFEKTGARSQVALVRTLLSVSRPA
jgi:DNA-binding CsgD family transcriptional regulator